MQENTGFIRMVRCSLREDVRVGDKILYPWKQKPKFYSVGRVVKIEGDVVFVRDVDGRESAEMKWLVRKI